VYKLYASYLIRCSSHAKKSMLVLLNLSIVRLVPNCDWEACKVLTLRLSTVASGKWAATLNVADLVQNQTVAVPGKAACIFWVAIPPAILGG
jgi:hypothetical protein